MRVLELVDISGDKPVMLGDTATLDQNGNVVYKGAGVKAIFAPFLGNHEPSEVFDKMVNWSNGYVQLQERGQE